MQLLSNYREDLNNCIHRFNEFYFKKMFNYTLEVHVCIQYQAINKKRLKFPYPIIRDGIRLFSKISILSI